MKFLIINPQLLFNSQDKLTTGIIYLPIAIASISANLKKSAIDHKVLDLFGNAPKKINKLDNFFVLGENIEKYSDEIKSYDAIFVYANQVINHLSIINIIKQIRSIDKTVKIITFENKFNQYNNRKTFFFKISITTFSFFIFYISYKNSSFSYISS